MIDTKVGDLLRWTYRDRSWLVVVVQKDVWATLILWPDGDVEDKDNYDGDGTWEVVSESR